MNNYASSQHCRNYHTTLSSSAPHNLEVCYRLEWFLYFKRQQLVIHVLVELIFCDLIGNSRVINPPFILGAGSFSYAVSGFSRSLLTHNKLNNHFWIYQSLQFSSKRNILSKKKKKCKRRQCVYTHNCDLFVFGPEFAILKIPLPKKKLKKKSFEHRYSGTNL